MHILRLTTSNDVNERVPMESRGWFVAQSHFAREVKIDAETTVKVIWPAPELPDIIDRWMERYRPDMVVLVVSSYWMTYESVPLRLKRRAGPLGRPVADAGLKVASIPWLSENFVFHKMRGLALRTIGGEPSFTPDEVVDVVEACARRVLARESTVLMVRGPWKPVNADAGQAGMARAEQRRLETNAGLQRLCARLHVECLLRDTPPSDPTTPDYMLGDFVHETERAQKERGAVEGAVMVRAWRDTGH